ncbi:MAG: 16S rRNA (uracil(1498)-N(3))-methyltransferase [Gammaproteobacteria bacterium]|nr:16S rRNA (uracil(1498)-N(3))-methyltransferase [Gammaproteobacteria bacterium]
MRVSRFFINALLFQGEDINLPAHLVNYIVNVLRLKVGDTITLFNGQLSRISINEQEQIGEFTAIITEATKRNVTVHIEIFTARNTQSPLQVHLFQGISRSERMDFTIQKAVELGITQITPVFTQRSNSGKINAKRLEKKMLHWQGIAISACEQSGRTTLIKINEPIQVKDIQTFNAEINLLLAPDAQSSLSKLSVQSPQSINIFIGPEGGLNDDEIDWASNHGYQKIKLGNRILRTETAGLAILSVLQFLWGDLG